MEPRQMRWRGLPRPTLAQISGAAMEASVPNPSTDRASSETSNFSERGNRQYD